MKVLEIRDGDEVLESHWIDKTTYRDIIKRFQ